MPVLGCVDKLLTFYKEFPLDALESLFVEAAAGQTLMANMRYRKAPLTEAVVEFRLSSPISESNIAKIARSLKNTYPVQEQSRTIDLAVNADSVNARQSPDGYVIRSLDSLDQFVVRRDSVLTLRLAPYLGFDTLSSTMRENWKKIEKYKVFRDVWRIGLRFVNRLDLPGTDIRLGDWGNFSFDTPVVSRGTVTDFTVRAVSRTGSFGAILAFQSVPSPIIDHSSLLIDIDTFIEHNLPEREEDFWAVLQSLREMKNDLFERSITDRTRTLLEPLA